MRFDGHRYRDCRWCHGRGCLYCEGEADKAYRAEFPNGPVQLATFKLDQIAPLGKDVFGADAMRKAFGSDGGGMAEIVENLATMKQHALGDGRPCPKWPACGCTEPIQCTGASGAEAA